MSDDTPILKLPLIQPAQAQKHVTHNEALRLLDITVQLAVLDRDLNAPPANPAEGDRYIVGPAPTGAWTGRSGQIAAFWGGVWVYVPPGLGWQARVIDEATTVIHQGGQWAEASAVPEILPDLGIATPSDATNRLAVAAPATLFTHAGAGHQLKLNKATPTDTGSLLFQTGFSGRAEIGLAGSDALSVKVSADGAAFQTALTTDPATGRITTPAGLSAPLTLAQGTGPSLRTATLDLGALTVGSPRSYALPDISSELAALAGVQTFSGAKTFAGPLSASTATVSIGTASTSASYGFGTGPTASGSAKTVQIGTGGAAGSTTSLSIGPTQPGAMGTLTLNGPTVALGPTVTDFDMGSAAARATALGLGGATGDGTNRLAVNSPAILLNHAGNGMEVTINKSTPQAQGMIAFQTGGSPRAQLGLMGSDDLSLRLSSDGTTFATVLTAEAATGRTSFAQPVVLAGLGSDPSSPADGTLWHNAANGSLSARVAGQTVHVAHQQDIPWLTPPAGEYVPTTTGVGGAVTGTLAGAAGRMDIFPFLPRADFSIDRLAVNCTAAAAAAFLRGCFYAADALGRPANLLLETPDIDATGIGVRMVTTSFSFQRGRTYWIGIRHSSTSTIATWPLSATPDINGGAVSTALRKVLRRTVAWATPAPATWTYTTTEANPAAAPAIWLRMA